MLILGRDDLHWNHDWNWNGIYFVDSELRLLHDDPRPKSEIETHLNSTE